MRYLAGELKKTRYKLPKSYEKEKRRAEQMYSYIRVGKEPWPGRKQEMVLYFLPLYHGIGSLEKDMVNQGSDLWRIAGIYRYIQKV